MIANVEDEALRIEVQTPESPLQGPWPKTSGSGPAFGGPSAVQVYWRGKSNSRYPAKVLDPFLSELAVKAGRAGLPVDMHFETLEYCNSSTISAIIRFIRAAKENKLQIRMIYSERASWQKLSFESLGVFADDQLVFESCRPE
jgi:hypothetical protein